MGTQESSETHQSSDIQQPNGTQHSSETHQSSNTQHSSVFTSSTNPPSNPLSKEAKKLEKEISTLIKDVLGDLKMSLKLQKSQMKRNIRNMDIANKQEILQQTEEGLQAILMDIKDQIRMDIEQMEKKEDAISVSIEADAEKKPEISKKKIRNILPKEKESDE
ncbi:hypothetical protein NKR74_21955 [Bacillus sp. 3103sda1]|uniref:hypothetical protein n=1 Tax=Bacillus sp. 3103sda1 TaxID=2953808 RepID=UPI0020A1B39D|nr:hypothetical protein [Bacillus sp. 3103sda1]MCP1125938.1 hypothetical protein [Bacillus sp. 3103sda1]